MSPFRPRRAAIALLVFAWGTLTTASVPVAAQRATPDAEPAADAPSDAPEATSDAPEATSDAPGANAPEEEGAETAPREETREETREANPFASDPEPEETTPTDELPPALQAEDIEIPSMRPARRVERQRAPLRVYGRLGAGLGVRLTVEDQFQQDRLAPAFLDLAGGVVIPGAGPLRHAFQLGVNSNIDPDGSGLGGIRPFTQWVVTPSYVARIALSDDPVPFVQLTGRVGVPLTLSPDFNFGGEVAIGAQLLFLAGIGAYIEAGYSLFFGGQNRAGDTSMHHILAVSAGATIDFELLP